MKLTRRILMNHAKHNLPPFLAGYFASKLLSPEDLLKLLLKLLS